MLDVPRIPLHQRLERGGLQPPHLRPGPAAPRPRLQPQAQPPPDQPRIVYVTQKRVEELRLHDVVALRDRHRVYEQEKPIRRLHRSSTGGRIQIRAQQFLPWQKYILSWHLSGTFLFTARTIRPKFLSSSVELLEDHGDRERDAEVPLRLIKSGWKRSSFASLFFNHSCRPQLMHQAVFRRLLLISYDTILQTATDAGNTARTVRPHYESSAMYIVFHSSDGSELHTFSEKSSLTHLQPRNPILARAISGNGSLENRENRRTPLVVSARPERVWLKATLALDMDANQLKLVTSRISGLIR